MKAIDLKALTDRLAYRYMDKALKATDGSVTEAAKLLGMNRTTLVMRMRARARKERWGSHS